MSSIELTDPFAGTPTIFRLSNIEIYFQGIRWSQVNNNNNNNNNGGEMALESNILECHVISSYKKTKNKWEPHRLDHLANRNKERTISVYFSRRKISG